MNCLDDCARWSHFDHVADMGVQATGSNLGDAFAQAALGMMAIVTDVEISAVEAVAVCCQAPDEELLLIDWLNTLIFEMATRRLLFGRFEVHIERNATNVSLTATAWGEPVNRDKHHPAVELKGATYTALDVHREEDDTWTARCVIDV